MKKFFALLLCLLLAAALTIPAAADVIWEPYDNFYFDHFGECDLTGQSFTTTQDTALYESPEDSTVICVFPAGEEIWVSCVWHSDSGDEWGYVELYDDGWTQGWFDMTHPDASPTSSSPTLTIVLVVVVAASTASALAALTRKKR